MGKAILFFLIPLFISIVAIIWIKSDHKPEVVHLAAAYGPGTSYQLEPAEYTVTASPHFRWTNGTGATWKIIVGILVFAAGAGFILTDPKIAKGFIVLGISWLLAFGLIFGKHVKKYYGPGGFEKTISSEQYEQNKDNLDAIFQQ
jgi:hypothetical protein